ncbi:hypothetical protein C4D60_Mb02t23340 [Musa balbisiana]|uniref:Uncharacterized protein n=1 Tax=Musa balbisiana TaxID=52838 RepID=A0A4S8ICT4_MUSBA|nr:hypothetical protein C4D60_Mb02t23340 [Musa balbisiana]
MSAAARSGALLLCRRHRLRPPYPVVILSRTSLPERPATPFVPPRFPPLCMGSNLSAFEQQLGGRNHYRVPGGRSPKEINPKLRI